MKEALVTPAAEADKPSRRVQRRGNLAAAAFWLFGSALVALAQPGNDRRLAAVGRRVTSEDHTTPLDVAGEQSG